MILHLLLLVYVFQGKKVAKVAKYKIRPNSTCLQRGLVNLGLSINKHHLLYVYKV